MTWVTLLHRVHRYFKRVKLCVPEGLDQRPSGGDGPRGKYVPDCPPLPTFELSQNSLLSS